MSRLINLRRSNVKPLSRVANKTSKVRKGANVASLAVLLSSALALSACIQQNEASSNKTSDIGQKHQTKPKPQELNPELSVPQSNTLVSQEAERSETATATQVTEAKQRSAEHTRLKPSSVVAMEALSGQDYQEGARKVMPSQINPRVIKMNNQFIIDIAERGGGSRDRFAIQKLDGIKLVSELPVSTFSVDVDTGGYSTMRRWLNQGKMPVQNTIRVEELINYFDYHYPVPKDKSTPFSIATELAPSPYNHGRQLLRVGVQGYEVDKASIGASNLVFLLDVSGSMASPDKLPLLKQALMLLTQQLNDQDKVSIVVYAGASGMVLDGVSGNQTREIGAALKKLSSGGSTNGGAGIALAYDLAQKHFIPDGNNRVILATDGDFNVGTTDQAALERLIQQQRKSGVTLTTLGFGQGNYNDTLMEQLANKGNGIYAYIDTLNEAKKVLVDELPSQILTIANDVKIQVEFNPAVVAEYRLIGYQNRRLKREDFNNDKVDAGEVGAGHNVTALYEISYVNSTNQANDPLRYEENRGQIAGYQVNTEQVDSLSESNETESTSQQIATSHNELAYIKLRYKPSINASSQLLSHVVKVNKAPQLRESMSLSGASESLKFAAAVAGFGQLLNGGQYLDNFDYARVEAIAKTALGDDKFGYRHEFLQLVRTAALLESLSTQSSILEKVEANVVEPMIESLPK